MKQLATKQQKAAFIYDMLDQNDNYIDLLRNNIISDTLGMYASNRIDVWTALELLQDLTNQDEHDFLTGTLLKVDDTFFSNFHEPNFN